MDMNQSFQKQEKKKSFKKEGERAPLSTPAGKLSKMSLEPTAQVDRVEVSGDFAGTLSTYGPSD